MAGTKAAYEEPWMCGPWYQTGNGEKIQWQQGENIPKYTKRIQSNWTMLLCTKPIALQNKVLKNKANVKIFNRELEIKKLHSGPEKIAKYKFQDQKTK